MVNLPCLHVTGHIPFASGANVHIRFFLHNAILHRKLAPTHRSMVDLPCLHVTGHIPFASGANVNIRFFLHNAILHRKLLPTHCSMVYFPCLHVTGHIPFASGANVNIRFFLHNAILHRKLLPTHCSMVYFPCLHVTGHIPFASGANVNIRFFLHNAILHRKLLPTHCSMVYFPCLHVTGHIPFARGANVHIPFRNDLRVPHLETVTACAPVIYLARPYTAPHRLFASGTNISETLAFPRCFDFICQQRHRLRRAALALLLAAHFCLPVCASFRSAVFSTLLCLRLGFLHLGGVLCFPFSFHAGPDISRRPHRPLPFVAVFPLAMSIFRPVCAHFCSVLLFGMLCLRLCVLHFGALLFSVAFSFRDGVPDTGDGTYFFFLPLPSSRLLPALQLPAVPLCWCFSGEWGTSSSCYRLGHHYKNDVAPATVEKRTLLASPCRRCISTGPMLYPNNLNTLYRPCVLVSTPRQNISFRPCAYCKHYTLASVRTSHKCDKMWLVGLHVLRWMHLPVSRPCMPCIATASASQRADECILCILSPHLCVSIDQPWMQKPALIHYILCIPFRLGISLAARSNLFERQQQQFPPYFCAFLKRCCRERSVHKQTMPVLDPR